MELMEQARNGDGRAFEELFVAFNHVIRHEVKRRLRQPRMWNSTDSDLVQDTMVKIFGRWVDYRGTTDAELRVWLRQIIDRTALNHVRWNLQQKRDIRREQTFDDTETEPIDPKSEAHPPEAIVADREESARIQAALASLAEDDRQLISWRRRGLSFEEIGERHGIPADAARKRFRGAVMELARVLAVQKMTRL
jgi:RNA polymerase sigma factor (sigma-70 family)